MSERTIEDLRQMQALPLSVKISLSKSRIRQWYKEFDGQVDVSFSGGKDSTVLLHLVRSMYPDVEAVFFDTGLEYPEIRNFALSHDNVTRLKPSLTFRQVIEQFGYPVVSKDVSKSIYCARKHRGDMEYWANKKLFGLGGLGNSRYNQKKWQFLLDAPYKISNQCCYYMKKAPAHKYMIESGKVPMTAEMAEESMLRQQAWIRTGCNGFSIKKSKPLSFWTNQDILTYLKKYNVPYCREIYGDIVVDEKSEIDGQLSINDWFGDYEGCRLKTTGAKRTGCMFCAFGVHLEKEPNRFQRMKKIHPKIWEYCMKPVDEGGLGLKEVLEYIGVKCE